MTRYPARARPTCSRRRVRILTLLAWVAGLLVGQLALAPPVFAHAELVSTTPGNGERLVMPPTDVTLRFTDQIGLVDGGLQLLHADTGDPVSTPSPVVDDTVVSWQMPPDLPAGAYLVNWRVLSADTHPIAGAFSFGIGADVAPALAGSSSTFVSWPVTTTRWAGYVGFATVAGVTTFTLLCWPPGRSHQRTRRLLKVGLLAGVTATMFGLLLQGPYVAGVSATRLFSHDLLAETVHTSFGVWMQMRLLLYLALAMLLWAASALELRLNRWLAGVGLVAVAVTFSGTGHAAASGDLMDKVVNSVHVLTAGIWVGGLLTVVVLAAGKEGRPSLDAFVRFSRVAMFSVLALVVTGTISALLQVHAVAELWQSGYGQLLIAKLVLVLAALAGAAVSRRTLRARETPWRPVRFEAAATGVVLAVTAALTLTAPPASTSTHSTTAASDATTPMATTVTMSLGEERTAELHVDGVSTAGSSLHLEVLDHEQHLFQANEVNLQATLPNRDLGPMDVPLTEAAAGWFGDFTFPLPGRWKLTLAVEDKKLAAVVTAGTVRIA
jgi:copper transport protein